MYHDVLTYAMKEKEKVQSIGRLIESDRKQKQISHYESSIPSKKTLEPRWTFYGNVKSLCKLFSTKKHVLKAKVFVGTMY